MSETIRPAVYPVDEDDCPSRLERAERDLAACRALLAELVAALHDEGAGSLPRAERALDAAEDWLAAHPAEEARDE